MISFPQNNLIWHLRQSWVKKDKKGRSFVVCVLLSSSETSESDADANNPRIPTQVSFSSIDWLATSSETPCETFILIEWTEERERFPFKEIFLRTEKIPGKSNAKLTTRKHAIFESGCIFLRKKSFILGYINKISSKAGYFLAKLWYRTIHPSSSNSSVRLHFYLWHTSYVRSSYFDFVILSSFKEPEEYVRRVAAVVEPFLLGF